MFSFMIPFVLALLARLATAVPTNFTIDDSNGIDGVPDSAPLYSSSNVWRARNADETCSECAVNPTATRMLDKTWHDTTSFPGDAQPARVSFHFTGTAIYIACALAGQQPTSAIVETHLLFFVDGQYAGNFDYAPVNDDYQYESVVFSKNNLTESNHSVIIVNRHDVGRGSVLLFDYAKFTAEGNGDDIHPPSDDPTLGQPDPSAPPPRKVNPAIIAVGVSLGLLALSVLVWLVWFLSRRRRARMEQKHYAMKRNTSLLMSAIRNPGEPSIAGDAPWK